MNTLIFMDYETGSISKARTQPISIGAVAINPRTLSFSKNDIFYSLMKPVLNDEQALSLGLDPIQDGALKVNRLTRPELETAPETNIVWQKFVAFVNRYRNGTSIWGKPVCCGFNNTGFDDIITDRLCSKAPYNFGPVSKDGQTTLFHQRDNFDLQRLLAQLLENCPGVSSMSMDSMREFFGFPQSQAHRADVDCIEGAVLYCRILSHFRRVYTENKLRNAMKDFKIEEYL